MIGFWIAAAWGFVTGKNDPVEPTVLPSVAFTVLMAAPLYMVIGAFHSDAPWSAVGISLLTAAGLLATPRLVGNTAASQADDWVLKRWLGATTDQRIKRRAKYERGAKWLTWLLRLLVLVDAIVTVLSLVIFIRDPESSTSGALALTAVAIGFFAFSFATVLWLVLSFFEAIADEDPRAQRQTISATEIAQRLDSSPNAWALAGALFIAGTACQYIGTFMDGS